MSAVVHAADPGGRHWLSFRIGAQLYAAPLAEVSEVIRDGELTPVPGAADDLLGVRHLRGRIVPVLDGRLRLGLSLVPPADPATVRIVMLSAAGQLIGVRVDAVGELLDARRRRTSRRRRRDGPAGAPIRSVACWRGKAASWPCWTCRACAGWAERPIMWLEIGVGLLLLFALAQAAVLVRLWRQSQQLQRDVAALSHGMSHVSTDVPTSMLVTALGRLERRIGLIEAAAAGAPVLRAGPAACA